MVNGQNRRKLLQLLQGGKYQAKSEDSSPVSNARTHDNHSFWSRTRSGDSTQTSSSSPISKSERDFAPYLSKAAQLTETISKLSDALPPLKLTMDVLTVILENGALMGENVSSANELRSRIASLSQTWSEAGREAGKSRQLGLERTLADINKKLEPIGDPNGDKPGFLRRCQQFLLASENKARIEEYLVTVDRALLDYQLSLVQDLHNLAVEQIEHAHKNVLEKLSPIGEALFNASDDRRRCLPGTRVNILRILEAWANDVNAKQILWLSGHAGSGKSTIAQSFAEALFAHDKLGASFFCSRNSLHRSSIKSIVPTLAFQLARARNAASSAYRASIISTLQSNPIITASSLHEQLQYLIVEPAVQSDMDTIIFIDALDECVDDNSTSIILDLLSRVILRIPKVKIFITSRPEPHIRSGFRLESMRSRTETVVLHEVDAESVNQDIRLFLEYNLSRIAKSRSDLDVSHPWPSKDELEELTKKSAGLFVFASTAVRSIESAGDDPSSRLQQILREPGGASQLSRYDLQELDEVNPYESLDKLYLGILEGAFSVASATRLRSVLSLLVVSCEPLSIPALAQILDLVPSTVKSTLRTLHSIVLVPEDPAGALHFYHKSFPDFITNPTRCAVAKYRVDVDDSHFRAAQRSLELMRRELRKNICGLPRYSMNSVLDNAIRDQRITETVRYCCRHWSNHLLADSSRRDHLPTIRPALEQFLKTQQLMWFEVLSLIQELGRAVEILNEIRDWITSLEDDRFKVLLDWAIDGHRFILAAFDVASVSAAHLYHSMPIFAPEASLLKQGHAEDLKGEARVVLGALPTWSGHLRTIPIPHGGVDCLEYSPSGEVIAMGNWSGSGTPCHLFRASTGQHMARLSADMQQCRALSVSFSCDSKLLAAAVRSSILPYSSHILLWDVRSGAIYCKADVAGDIDSLDFYPTSQHASLLISMDRGGRLSTWQVGNGTLMLLHTFALSSTSRGLESVKSPSFHWFGISGDATVLTSTLSGPLKLWTVNPPREVMIFDIPPGESSTVKITAIAPSNHKWLAAAGVNKSLIVWDGRTGAVLHHVKLETYIDSLYFPQSDEHALRVITSDREVMLYNITNDEYRLISSYEFTTSYIFMSFSPDGRYVVCDNWAQSLHVWETATLTGRLTNSPIYRHLQRSTSAHFSNDGRFLVSGSHDKTVVIWDTKTGGLYQTFTEHTQEISDAIFLQDDTRIVSMDRFGEVILWNLNEDGSTTDIRICDATFSSNRLCFLAPFTHNASGFFYINHDSTPECLECWTIRVAEDTRAPERLVKVAQGYLPRDHSIRRIDHLIPEATPADIVIRIEHEDGIQSLAVWRDATQPAELWGSNKEPASLEFDGAPGYDVLQQRPLVGAEQRCGKEKGEIGSWVLDDRGRKILWLSVSQDGDCRWYGEKLLVQPGDHLRTGSLMLLDFSSACLDDDMPF